MSSEQRERQSRPRSRANSISKGSRAGTSLSRSQSLIRKQTAVVDLKPSDVLIERFVAWKAIVKQLLAYFQGLADVQAHTAKELIKLGAVIQVPFRAGNHFLGEGGVQDVYYGIRDKTRGIAEQHANFGRTIEGSIVLHLQKLRAEIKAHIKNIQNDTGKLATTVGKERELSTSLISTLASSISTFKNTPLSLASTPKQDPYVANTAVQTQLRKQVHAENLLQKSIIITQANSAHFESGIVQALQSAWATYDEWHTRMSTAILQSHSALASSFAALTPDAEWLAFSARTDHLLDPETPLRNPDLISYPSREDPSVQPVHVGILQRKRRYTRAWRETYFVLTPAGFLHEFASSDSSVAPYPVFSLFLPACTLGPPSSNSSGSHKFHIEGRKDGSGTTKGGGSIRRRVSVSLGRGKGGSGGGEHAWSFRARSREEMMEWWNDVRMLCARYLVASESIERSGPVEAAVRAAGYSSDQSDQSDEEEGDSDDEDLSDVSRERGSSVSEEESDGEYAEAMEDEGPPGYGSHMPGGMAEVGENGFPIDKKPKRTPSTASRKAHPIHHDDEEREGANVVRRQSASSSKSKRQQEKSRADDDVVHHDVAGGHEEVPEKGGSRFTEGL